MLFWAKAQVDVPRIVAAIQNLIRALRDIVFSVFVRVRRVHARALTPGYSGARRVPDRCFFDEAEIVETSERRLIKWDKGLTFRDIPGATVVVAVGAGDLSCRRYCRGLGVAGARPAVNLLEEARPFCHVLERVRINAGIGVRRRGKPDAPDVGNGADAK